MNNNKWFLNGGRESGKSFRLLCETYENKIADLEKENAELKERLKEHESVGNAQFWENVWSWKTKVEHLIKATEIIKNLIAVYYDPVVLESDIKLHNKIITEAKQFISEEEK